MGCDYYIYPYLKIIHQHGIDYYALNMKRGYYSEFLQDCTDSDQDYSEDENERKVELTKLYETYQEIILRSVKPKILYQNQKWTHKEYKKKYETYVKSYINGNDSPYGEYKYFQNEGQKLKEWNDILSIQKMEFRRNWDD